MSNISLPKPKSTSRGKRKKKKEIDKKISEFAKIDKEPEHLKKMREEFREIQDK